LIDCARRPAPAAGEPATADARRRPAAAARGADEGATAALAAPATALAGGLSRGGFCRREAAAALEAVRPARARLGAYREDARLRLDATGPAQVATAAAAAGQIEPVAAAVAAVALRNAPQLEPRLLALGAVAGASASAFGECRAALAPLIAAGLRDVDARTRETACWALGRLFPRDAPPSAEPTGRAHVTSRPPDGFRRWQATALATLARLAGAPETMEAACSAIAACCAQDPGPPDATTSDAVAGAVATAVGRPLLAALAAVTAFARRGPRGPLAAAALIGVDINRRIRLPEVSNGRIPGVSRQIEFGRGRGEGYGLPSTLVEKSLSTFDIHTGARTPARALARGRHVLCGYQPQS